jgi:carboxymethylenebutenolidase
MSGSTGPFAGTGCHPSDRYLAAGVPLWMFEPGAAARGAVVVLHHRTGLDGFMADVVTRLTAGGFVSVVPDLFAGQPVGLGPEERKCLLRDDAVLTVLAEGVRLMAVGGLPVAALGFCMGGRLAFLAGVAGIGIDRACCFYPGEIDRGWHASTAPLERVGAGAADTQLHRGARDSNATAAQFDAAVAAFDQAGAYLEACTYSGARHAFANPYATERYHPVAAARAWAGAMAFLDAADGRALQPSRAAGAGYEVMT